MFIVAEAEHGAVGVLVRLGLGEASRVPPSVAFPPLRGISPSHSVMR